MESLKKYLKHWLNNALMHAKILNELLSTVRLFFKMCRHCKIKLHPRKGLHFPKVVTWCGRKISAKDVQLGPRRLKALLKTEPPTTGAVLQQLLCTPKWLENGNQFFSKLDPLNKFLETVN